jgi:ubiquinone/menaquinone biosynthesis C-methylase UbiE
MYAAAPAPAPAPLPDDIKAQERVQRRRWDAMTEQNYDNWRAQRRTEFFDELYLDAVQGPDVLEVGCGQGDMLRKIRRKLPNANLVGMDLSPTMLGRAQRRGVSNLAIASGNALPYRSERFDTVLAATWVIRYLALDVALGEMFRVAKPGGRIMFDLPFLFGHAFVELSRVVRQRPGLWIKYLRDAYFHLDGRWVPSWRRRIEAAGFKVLDIVGGWDSPVRSARLSFRAPHRGPLGLAASTIIWFLAEKPS